MRLDELRGRLAQWAQRAQLVQRVDLYGPWAGGRHDTGEPPALAIAVWTQSGDGADAPALERQLRDRWHRQLAQLLPIPVSLTIYCTRPPPEVERALAVSNIPLYERSARTCSS
jgi:hypothetical protein